MSVITEQYGPITVNHDMQQLITDHMVSIVKAMGTKTLAEMGYLYMNSLTFHEGAFKLKCYFAPEIMNKHYEELEIFKNRLFVGDLMKALTTEEICVPKYKIKKDSNGVNAVVVKDKLDEETKEVVVLNCNPNITFASAYDIRLDDPNYGVFFKTVGETGNRKHDIMIRASARNEHPVETIIQFSEDHDSYDPEDAVPYLIELRRSMIDNENKKRKKNLEIVDEADKINDKKKKRFMKYR